MPHRRVFVSYSRRDVEWLERLRVHLRPLERAGQLDLWDDSRLTAGDDWRAEIRQAMATASASVVLLSADFLASAFIASEELPRILDRTRAHRVVPIYVQPCRVSHVPALAKLQAVNQPQWPLSKVTPVQAEEVFVRAAEQIERLLGDGQGETVDGAEPVAATLLYEELRFATIATAMLHGLAHRAEPRTLSELSDDVGVRARAVAFRALERLEQARWIARQRADGRTRYAVTELGRETLRRLDWVASRRVALAEGAASGSAPRSRPEMDDDPEPGTQP